MRRAKQDYRVVGDLSVTDTIMTSTFWVGVYPGMTDEMIDYMARTIIDAVRSIG
jgi:CDP-6-deoxy-D-xylo-4-hexulose-3-dehydrase